VAGRAVRYAAPRASAWISRGGSACAFNSFSAETPVATPNGPKPISEVELGDQVLAYYEPLETTGSYTVTDLISHQDQVITHLTIAGERLETTPEHAFYTDERGWVPAQDLQVGMHIWRADGTMGAVQSVLQVQQPQRMYNLSVAEAHTFFVGDGAWLVHNAKCGGDTTWTRRGREAHRALRDKVLAKGRGWRSERTIEDKVTGKKYRPDIITPSGRPIELKPNTPSGCRAGQRQLRIYERLLGKKGRVIYYNK
jgi:hypothetical protein